MNDQEFILLMEEYLDGSITPQDRMALRTEVLNNPIRRQLFENQARQHIRLHAQTSRIDFSETQRIAFMVMDIAEKQKEPNAFLEVIRKKSFRERISLITKGLRSAPNTVAHRVAKDELIRMVGPATLSIVVNVAALLLLLLWVPYIIPPPIVGESGEGGVVINLGEPEPATPDADPQRERSTDNTTPDGTPATADLTKPPDSPLTFPNTGVSEPTEFLKAFLPKGPEGDISAGDDSPSRLKPRNLPRGLYDGTPHGNRDPKLRADILISQKAQRTEDAVLRSLRWLKTNQAADGSWPGQEVSAMTGLALLSYLAHGDLPSTPEFGETVTRGLKFLLMRQDSQGSFSKNVYAHAIATYAIAEAFTMTRIMDLKGPLENGIRIIINGQQTNGGFDYHYQKGPRFDTSVSGWQIQALKAARTAVPDMPGLDDALTRSTRFLLYDAVARDGSGFVYSGNVGTFPTGGGKISMTGVGTLCLQMLDKNTSTPVKTGLRLLQNVELDWPATGKAGVYAGYYVTQAKFQSGNQSEWMRWNLHMQRVLLSKQHKDGHWGKGDYETGANVYTTTLCTLMLEVYYRYLPSYVQRSDSDPKEKRISGDVPIDVL